MCSRLGSVVPPLYAVSKPLIVSETKAFKDNLCHRPSSVKPTITFHPPKVRYADRRPNENRTHAHCCDMRMCILFDLRPAYRSSSRAVLTCRAVVHIGGLHRLL